MAYPFLALERVSFRLPDGRSIFSNLNEQFDHRPTGLVGRNGVGKTVLARLLAGELEPSSGRCLRSGSVRLLGQRAAWDVGAGATVAGLAGIQPVLDAITRIEAGSIEASDFEQVGERWDIAEHLQRALDRHGLGHLDSSTPVSTLSGGEAVRVSIVGALLSTADFLILDEPSNHLDQPSRQALVEQLRAWPRGLLVISHDRQLLAGMARIVELSSLGLRSYGGGYAFYAEQREQEQQLAREQLDRCRLERLRQERSLRDQQERQERRLARGKRQAAHANQAKVLLGQQKARSETSTGKLKEQHALARQRMDEQVLLARQQVRADEIISVHAAPIAQAAQRRVLELQGVVLPFVSGVLRHIDLTVLGRQRVGVLGPNGCGKSTLLQVMAGRLRPEAGICRTVTGAAYLDQQHDELNPQRSALDQLQSVRPGTPPAEARMRLAQLGLEADHVLRPSSELSGGERMKAALACVLYADPPAPLVLLDEPSNHLDLPSLQALELMLSHHAGALVVVSHDRVFLDRVGLTHRLQATPHGWIFETWD